MGSGSSGAFMPGCRGGFRIYRRSRRKADAPILDICSIWQMRFESILLLVLFFVFLCTVLTVNALLNVRIHGVPPSLF